MALRRLLVCSALTAVLALVISGLITPLPSAAASNMRTLTLAYWQMPTTLNPHLVPRPAGTAPGTPSSNAARLILEMFTNSPSDLDYTEYLSGWLTKNIAQRSNSWTRMNFERFSSPAYDALFDQLTRTSDPTARAGLIVQMNDLLVSNVVDIPLIARRTPDLAIARSLCGVVPSSWDDETWNIASWSRATPAGLCPHRPAAGNDDEADDDE